MKVTAENYFSPEAEQFYMGSTQLKRFIQCEAGKQLYSARVRTETCVVGTHICRVDCIFERTICFPFKHKRMRYLQELAI